MSTDSNDSLTEYRRQIDEIDASIVGLLNRRAECAQAIGRIKAARGEPVYRPEREAQVLDHVAALGKGPLPAACVKAVYREVIGACRSIEHPLRVAYLGPVGTFSEMALIEKFGSSVQAIPCPTIDEIFRLTEAGSADFAVVPMENSTEGAVNRTQDLLLQTPLKIVGELSIPIHHNLMTRSGTLEGVKTVTAHSQALGQCTRYLLNHVPGLQQVAAKSNGEAARIASEDPAVAAIASRRAAQIWGLKIVSGQIEDVATNRTRFVVLGTEPCGPSRSPGRDKTSLIISVPNVAGAIYRAFEPLERYGVSMTRFESRPARNGAWAYYFYVDMEGHASDPVVSKALSELEKLCRFYKNLGSYPMGCANDGI